MAKKSKNTESKKAKNDEFAVPDGFAVNVGSERGDGWIAKVEGNIVQGRLLGRKTYVNNRGKKRAFYQIQLQKDCKCQVPNPAYDEDDETSEEPEYVDDTLGEGAIVNIDEFKKLEDLAPFVADGKTYDVWFAIVGKIDLGGDQTMWQIQGPKLRPVSS